MGLEGKILCPFCLKKPLQNYRSYFSSHKTITPVFGLDGPPTWVVGIAMKCTGICRTLVQSTDGRFLKTLPEYASRAYPVPPEYALIGQQHLLHRNVTQQFKHLLVTYSNGKHLGKMLLEALNQSFLDRVSSYYSYWDSKGKQAPDYIKDEGQ